MAMLSRLRSWNLSPTALALLVVTALTLATFTPTLAQTATPVPPTATPAVVSLVIDTNEIFTQTNSWIAQFTPIQAIGIGAALALAILAFVGAVIIGAFRQ